MKQLILLAGLFLTSFSLKAQSVKLDSTGNYIAVKATRDSTGTQAKPTGQTYTDQSGNVWPVYVSKNGKLFCVRISKSGNKYNFYFKP